MDVTRLDEAMEQSSEEASGAKMNSGVRQERDKMRWQCETLIQKNSSRFFHSFINPYSTSQI